jgi:tetratricopeptide (TPR) repeat protein
MVRTLLALFCLSSLAFGAVADLRDRREQPVGLVLNAGGSKLRRADTETPLAARAGELLFSGDTLKTESTPASFIFCPTKTIENMAPASEVRLDAAKPRVRIGKLSEQPASTCTLPKSLRIAMASEQYYGVTMTRGTNTPETPPVPRDKLPADVVAELVAINPGYASSDDPAVRIAAAEVFEKHDLLANALEIYYKLRELWPEAVWVKSKIFDLEELVATRTAAVETTKAGGQTYALLVGISKYKRAELSLQFANADAQAFSKLLTTPRGGGIDPNNILLLTDENATTAAVRNAFHDFLQRRAHKNDTVILVIAGHGTVEVPGSKNAFVLTYDSDPQDLQSTALPMSELRALFEEQLKNVGRVLLFVDICKAGTIGSIQNTTVSADVQRLGEVDGDLFGFLASRPKEVSVEGPQFGGGHGVFSYFVLKGLAGAADSNKDGVVDTNELIQYVSAQVPAATANRQHPREFGTYDNGLKLSDVTKPGIDVAGRMPWDSARNRPPFVASLAPPYVAPPQASDAADRFASAIQAGRLLPTDPNNAFDALRGVQSSVTQERYRELVNQLRIALENRAQAVLLRYLAGDQNPQSQQQFTEGARYMEAARTLTRESLFLEGRENFFAGRALLFDKKFGDAANLLEQSVRIDPGAAYAYNALGIAYLEQGQFDKAIPAFRDAFRRAQHWSYPLHNEALAHVETGDYQIAIRLYQQAMRLTPAYSYLPYNLGLIYQRINRRKDAEESYRKAMSLAPDSAEPYNALGTLRAAEGKNADAEKLYRDALQRNPDLLAARNNLANLLATEPNRRAESFELFRENLRRSPDYLPSRLGLAQAQADAGETPGAIAEYRRVLAIKPGYLGARTALAGLLVKSGDADGALVELREALKSDPENAAIFEQIGDIAASRNRAEAVEAYRSAIKNAPDRGTKKRIEMKLKSLR